VLEHGGHEHVGALAADTRRHARAPELLGEDRRDQRIGLEAAAAILLRDRARRVAVLDQQLLPRLDLRVLERRHLAAARSGGPVAVRRQERAQVAAEGLVLGSVGEIHAAPPAKRTW
jgi:hypothetical protein